MTGRRHRILNYAINGIGVGHLTRLFAISEALRARLQAAGRDADIFFLTTSEGDALLRGRGYPCFKLPSHELVARSGMDPEEYEFLGREWMHAGIELFAPDLLVVDTVPSGAFGELMPGAGDALSFCRRKAFVYRPVRPEVAAAPEFRSMLRRYDLILVPDSEEQAGVIVPPDLAGQVRFVGPVFNVDREQALPREEARRELGLSQDAFAVYLTTGGGGYESAEARLCSAVDALAPLEGVEVVAAAGPLYSGRQPGLANVKWTRELGAARTLQAFDLAVSGAGYNSFHELMYLGVPTIFVPMPASVDDQRGRALRAQAAGAGALLDPGLPPEALRAEVERWRHPGRLRAASEAARALVPENNAAAAAEELARLLP